MAHFFAAAIPLASQQLLSELYDLAKASPFSNTKDMLRKDAGLLFNGVFVAGTPSRCATICSVLTHILDIHMSLSSSAQFFECASTMCLVAMSCVYLQGCAAVCI